jgi:hypothetical protein
MRWFLYYALAAALALVWLRVIMPRIRRPLTGLSIVTLFLALALSRIASVLLIPCVLALIVLDPICRAIFRRVDAVIATDFVGVWQEFFNRCLPQKKHEDRMSAPT